jgi:hypothetical protein
MRRIVPWVVVVVLVLHGLIHLFGAVKGFGWANVSLLKGPIGPALGAAWLAAGTAAVSAAVLLVTRVRWWWIVGAVAVVASQSVIFTSWNDAKVGSVANVVLLAAVAYGYAAQGPRSYRAEYRRRVDAALSAPRPDGVVSEADLATLPQAVAAYVRRSGAIGQPRILNFRARIHGRIRSGADATWMTFTGEQVNTYGPEPSRLFIMDATLFGLPVDVLHTCLGSTATMRVKACSLVQMVNAAGPEMDRGETVTLLNDLCLLAPAALIGAPITWQSMDDSHVRATFVNGRQTVTAELAFNDKRELIDFVSDDRLRASRNGKSFLRQRWSTPVQDYRTVNSRRLFTNGEGRWHAPEPEGEFTYIEFSVDEILYNVSHARTDPRPHNGSDNPQVRHPAPALPPQVLIPRNAHVMPQPAGNATRGSDHEPVAVGVSIPIGRR